MSMEEIMVRIFLWEMCSLSRLLVLVVIGVWLLVFWFCCRLGRVSRVLNWFVVGKIEFELSIGEKDVS